MAIIFPTISFGQVDGTTTTSATISPIIPLGQVDQNTTSAITQAKKPGPTPTPTPTEPKVTLTINSGAGTFTDPLLTLTINAAAGSTKLNDMRFSQDNGTTWTDWEPFTNSKSLLLPTNATYGDRTVNIEVRDLNNNVASSSDTSTYTSAARTSMTLKTNYSFNASLNYDNATISTTETVNLINTSGGLLSTLNLSVPPGAWGEFTLGTVKVDGKIISPTWSNTSNLVIQLGRNLRVDDSTSVEISFKDIASSNITTSLQARLSKANGVMQVSQWFPIISDGHAMRYPGDSQFTATADNFHLDLALNRTMPVAAPGTISSPTSLTRVVDFGPARDFAFSVCPTCISNSGTVDNIKVQVYYLPGETGGTALTNAMSSLHTFNVDFGTYPYNHYIVAQASRPGAGNEYPGIIFIGSSYLDSLNYVRHETAHQWFYGLLGDDQLNAPWLDEAFGEWAGDGFASHSYCSSLAVSSSIYAFPNTPANLTNGNCNSYDQTVYYKGATFIAGVRTRMGSTAFFNSLRALVAANRFGIITTAMVANNWLNFTPASSQSSLKTYMQSYINW